MSLETLGSGARDDGADLQDQRDLMRRFCDGDQEAFEQLHAKYDMRIFHYILSRVGNYAIAEDLCSEVWLRVIDRKHTYNYNNPYTWIRQIAKYTMIDRLRRRSSSEVRMSDMDPGDGFDAYDVSIIDEREGAPDSHLELEELRKQVRSSMEELPDRDVQFLQFIDVEGHSYKEAAEHFQIKTGSVGAALYRARQHLRTKLEAA